MERELLPPDRRPTPQYGQELRVTPETAATVKVAAARSGDYQYIWVAKAVEAYSRYLRNDPKRAPHTRPRSGKFRTIRVSVETHAAIKAEAALYGLRMHEYAGHAANFFLDYQRGKQ